MGQGGLMAQTAAQKAAAAKAAQKAADAKLLAQAQALLAKAKTQLKATQDFQNTLNLKLHLDSSLAKNMELI